MAGFAVNFAGAFQDVAIDGMAIDLLDETERASANGLMWGGKTLGTAGFAFLTGVLISDDSQALAAIATAAFVGLVMLRFEIKQPPDSNGWLYSDTTRLTIMDDRTVAERGEDRTFKLMSWIGTSGPTYLTE